MVNSMLESKVKSPRRGFRGWTGRLVPVVCTVAVLCAARPAAGRGETSAHLDSEALRQSIVKIYVTTQRHNYLLPWQSRRLSGGTGTGFIIAGRRILTNAHVVSDARFLQVQKDGQARRYRARVTFIAHDCDLAMLTVDEPGFFDSVPALKLGSGLPALNDEVMVVGYPMGGTRISVTRGVVSRIDYSTYTHSGRDQHLVLQVDAAINPGNSGGPIFYRNEVVGLAFQGLTSGDNIGYGIPLPVLNHFLEDIADGTYHGYPELGVGFLETRNRALRRDLGLPDNESGVAIYMVDPFGSATSKLRPGDVLTAIDGRDIADDGTIQLEGNIVNFQEILERKQWGDAIDITVWRNGATKRERLSLATPYDPFMYRKLYDVQPRYFVYAGLVFAPLNRENLQAMRNRGNNFNTQQHPYYAQYAKIDKLYEGLDEFVIMINRLPHPVNTFAKHFEHGIVTHINDVRIRNLQDVKRALSQGTRSYHVFRFANMDDQLIMDAAAADAAGKEILESYAVSEAENLKAREEY